MWTVESLTLRKSPSPAALPFSLSLDWNRKERSGYITQTSREFRYAVFSECTSSWFYHRIPHARVWRFLQWKTRDQLSYEAFSFQTQPLFHPKHLDLMPWREDILWYSFKENTMWMYCFSELRPVKQVIAFCLLLQIICMINVINHQEEHWLRWESLMIHKDGQSWGKFEMHAETLWSSTLY